MVKRVLLLIGFIILSAVQFSCDPFEVDRSVDLDACVNSRCMITGYVYDLEGNPVGGVRITRGGAGVGYAITDKDGYYSIAGNVYGWTYCVTPGMEGWFFEPDTRCFDHINKNHKNQNFAGWIPNRYEISGYVLDDLARPMEKAFVSLEGEGGYSVKTDTSGFYAFRGVLEHLDYCVVPFVEDYTFEPAERCFENLSQNYDRQSFVGTETGG
jgi:protocatechuate 3,4-dioxygenase beta subunit